MVRADYSVVVFPAPIEEVGSVRNPEVEVIGLTDPSGNLARVSAPGRPSTWIGVLELGEATDTFSLVPRRRMQADSIDVVFAIRAFPPALQLPARPVAITDARLSRDLIAHPGRPHLAYPFYRNALLLVFHDSAPPHLRQVLLDAMGAEPIGIRGRRAGEPEWVVRVEDSADGSRVLQVLAFARKHPWVVARVGLFPVRVPVRTLTSDSLRALVRDPRLVTNEPTREFRVRRRVLWIWWNRATPAEQAEVLRFIGGRPAPEAANGSKDLLPYEVAGTIAYLEALAAQIDLLPQIFIVMTDSRLDY